MIKNQMELLVIEVFNEIKSMYGDCINEKCTHDIISLALNNLPTAYFPYDTQDSHKKAFLLDRQRRIAVLAKIAEAAESICVDCDKNTNKQVL